MEHDEAAEIERFVAHGRYLREEVEALKAELESRAMHSCACDWTEPSTEPRTHDADVPCRYHADLRYLADAQMRLLDEKDAEIERLKAKGARLIEAGARIAVEARKHSLPGDALGGRRRRSDEQR